jgi:hypothetical protein
MHRRALSHQAARIAGLAAAVVSLCGCGETERPKTIPISGHVTIDGQPPGEFGKLFFTPTQPAEGYVKRPASGSFDPLGNYRIMSWEPDDGLVPGHYTINISAADPNTKIPPKYSLSGTSGLEVDVPVDQGPIEANFDIVTK